MWFWFLLLMLHTATGLAYVLLPDEDRSFAERLSAFGIHGGIVVGIVYYGLL